MTDAWLLTSAPVAGVMLNVVVQCALSHAWRRRRTVAAMGCGAIAGLAAALGIAASAPMFSVLERTGWSAACYCGLAFGYWAFLNLNLTSLRIRVLKEILAAPGETLSHANLAHRYDDREMVERRLARLEASGQVARIGERYVLKSYWMARAARFARLLRRAIIPDRSSGTG